MFTFHYCYLLLLLLPILPRADAKRWVVVDLANGGTSGPLRVGPLDHEPPKASLPQALPLLAPTATPSSSQSKDGSQRSEGQSDNEVNNEGNEKITVTQVKDKETTDPKHTPTPTTTTTTSTTTTTTTTTSTTTTTTTTTPTTTTTTTKLPITTEDQAKSSSLPPTVTSPPPPPLQPCHQSCLDALNSTFIRHTDKLVLRAGSSLTLECQIPLVPDLIMEDMLWLFHPGGTPEGRCSLTPSKYLSSCPGFSFSETDYRNETFLKQTLTLSNMETNHTGNYMCQVQVTCCPTHQEHLMSQQSEVQVSVKVWWTDYTLELIGTGLGAMVLLVSLVGVSFYCWIHEKKSITHVVDVETPGILHLPLIDDQDTDSFNTSIDDDDDDEDTQTNTLQ